MDYPVDYGVDPRGSSGRYLERCSSGNGDVIQRTEWSARHWLMIGLVLIVAAAISIGVAVSVAYSGEEVTEAPEATTDIQWGLRATEPTTYVAESAVDVLKQVPLVDGHNDWPWNLRVFVQNKLSEVDLSQDLRQQEPWASSPWSHTDIPRLREGHVGAQFWAAYVPCEAQYLNAVQLTLEQIDVIKRFTSKYSNHFRFVTTAAGIEEAFANDLMASLIGVEGGHSMGNSLAVLRILYDVGVRYLTLTHNCHTPWAESHIADREQQIVHRGLTEFGKSVVKEMNRLGMLVDLAHVSVATMNDALDTTQAPVIFSHSSAHVLCNSTRNVRDSILRRVKQNGGIVMVTFFSPFVSCGDVALISQVADHVDYIRKTSGVEHVGIGGDFDGINRVPKGLEDVSKYPNLLMELSDRGWTHEDLKKVAGLNLLRVFRRVEEVRDQLEAAGVLPLEDLIPEEYLEGLNNCTYDFAV